MTSKDPTVGTIKPTKIDLRNGTNGFSTTIERKIYAGLFLIGKEKEEGYYRCHSSFSVLIESYRSI